MASKTAVSDPISLSEYSEEDFWHLVGDISGELHGVTVAVDLDHSTRDAHNPNSWMIRFTFRGPGFQYGFLVHEPYCSSLSDWRRLAAGESGIGFYMGNGDGSIEVDGEYMTFVGAPSGSGGDVTGKFRVRAADVGPLLSAQIDLAVERGYDFSPDRPSRRERI